MLFLQGVNRYFSSFFNKTAMLYAVFPNYFHFVSNFKLKSGCKKRQNDKMLKFRRHFLRAEFFICNFLFCQIYFTFLLFLLTKRSNRLRVLWPVFPPAFPGIKQRDTPIPPITSGTPPPETRITVWKHGLKTAKNTSKTSFYKLLFFRRLKTSKYKAYILKYKALILKYVPCIFYNKPCVFLHIRNAAFKIRFSWFS